MNWLSLSENKQVELFEQLSYKTGLLPQAIEKDAWVTLILRMLFTSSIAKKLTFKGGTSLSKIYGLINRFSEDIDVSIDREYLGFGGDLTKGQIRKLRKKSHNFTLNVMTEIIRKQLEEYRINQSLFEIIVENTKISDQDPETIKINYKSVFGEIEYLRQRVLIEIGARSSSEPYEIKPVQSLIDIHFPRLPISEKPFMAKVIRPEKTLLEKMILLHEEFSKPFEKIRYFRMSRHYYDIAQILQSKYGKKALQNKALFDEIIRHRAKYTPVKTVNYSELTMETLKIFPEEKILALYKKDYRKMQESMIYGKKQDFDEIIEIIKRETGRIND